MSEAISMGTIGLIAGGGNFPSLFAQSARRAGYRVVAIAHQGETSPDLAAHVDAIHWVKIGQIGRLTELLKTEGATQAVLLGSITKRRLFLDVMPDAVCLKIMAKLVIRSDDNLLRTLADHFASEGVPIVDAAQFLSDRLAPGGILGKHQPTTEERTDALYGLELARGIGKLDLGQTVVVKNRIALAVEAIEGTDACVRRGAELGKKGVVVVKSIKPGQDRRFDLPAVGPDTLTVMSEVSARVLAFEAGVTLVMDLTEMVKQANRNGIVLMGMNSVDA